MLSESLGTIGAGISIVNESLKLGNTLLSQRASEQPQAEPPLVAPEPIAERVENFAQCRLLHRQTLTDGSVFVASQCVSGDGQQVIVTQHFSKEHVPGLKAGIGDLEPTPITTS